MSIPYSFRRLQPLITTLVVAILLVGSALPALARDEIRTHDHLSDPRTQAYMPGEVVFKYRGDSERFRVLRDVANVNRTVAALRNNPAIEYVEPNYVATIAMRPNDPYYNLQWHFDNATYGGVNAEAAWDITAGANTVVAVIDTGVAYENYSEGGRGRWARDYYQAPDLADTCFTAGYDFINNDNHPNDDNSHGTHVAGTIAQSTNNNTGIAGLAHDTCIMPVKVLDASGSGSYTAVANGIYYAADNGANVINLSLGGPVHSQTLQDAVAYAHSKGVTVVAATGNENGPVGYPAAYDDYVIAVGATRFDEARAPYSNFGPEVDVVAPGGDMTVDQNGDGYVDGVLQQTINPTTGNTGDFGYYFFQGTSMATPHVAAAAAMVIAHGNASSPAEVQALLESTADDLGPAGHDHEYGHGLINIAAALGNTPLPPAPVDELPLVGLSSPAAGALISGTVMLTASSTDDVAVVQVDFAANGNLIGSDTDGSDGWSTAWDSTSVADGLVELTATAMDTASQTASDSRTVTVDNVNDAPVADAGADQVLSDGDNDGVVSTTLSGSASFDPDGTIVHYAWDTDGNGTLDATGETITSDFTVASSPHLVTLTVTDAEGASSTDLLIVTVTENQAPTADAGGDQTLTDDDGDGQVTVTLDGSGSSDADGTIVDYTWNVNGATLSGVNQSVALATGTYSITLTVTDNGSTTATDTITISVVEADPITLSTVGYKDRGRLKADLFWGGATGTTVNVLRDGQLLASTPNDGTYTDNIDQRGSVVYDYQVCETDVPICSPAVTTLIE